MRIRHGRLPMKTACLDLLRRGNFANLGPVSTETPANPIETRPP